ncbi:MAG: response regulator [Gammaproteobacteria bacterium]|nr:response regulator [Gammaproteobacteria bacterium]NIW99213.1 response regulator [Phycisphaerae bacterium]
MSKKVTVMIIDDEIHMRRLIGRMLKGAGFEVIEVATGAEALRILRHAPEKPDLVTCDISMPDLNGFEILETIRSSPELINLPVIMLTAMGQLSDADRAKKMGATDYITKPFSALSLINIVRQQTEQVA